MSDKERRSKKIMEDIRQILLHQWDPIGIKDEPNAQDEYDSYVGGVYRLLASHASAEEIAKHLAVIETGQMGLGRGQRQDLLPVAQRLVALNIQL